MGADQRRYEPDFAILARYEGAIDLTKRGAGGTKRPGHPCRHDVVPTLSRRDA